MLKLFKKENILPGIFVLIELTLWILILFVNTHITRELEFVSVCLAALFAFLDLKHFNLIKLGFIFIILGDLFLTLLSPSKVIAGLCSFICVSLIFAVYIFVNQKDQFKMTHLAIRALFTFIAGLLVGLLVPDVNAVLILTAVYGVNLILNVVLSFSLKQKNVLFITGLICFLLCDIYVGISCAKDMGIFEYHGSHFIESILGYGFNLAWFFYIPCLTLLSLASKKR